LLRITDGHQSTDLFVLSTANSSASDLASYSLHFDHMEPSMVVCLLESLDIRKSTNPWPDDSSVFKTSGSVDMYINIYLQ